MHKHYLFLSLIITAFLTPVLAQAEIYKQVDSEGRVTYSNVKLKGAKRLDIEQADTNFGGSSEGSSSGGASVPRRAPQAKTPTPASFPKVDAGTQNQRDGKRKEVLASELDAEKAALENAKKAYSEGEGVLEVHKTAGGKTIRNVEKYNEKMKGLQAEVDAHQRNIDLLNKEIGN
jgi:Domain of unknown function (DUF4124)